MCLPRLRLVEASTGGFSVFSVAAPGARAEARTPPTPHPGSGMGSGIANERGSPSGDAVSALVNLGYRQSEAYGAVSCAAQNLGEGASIEALIQAGLKELST